MHFVLLGVHSAEVCPTSNSTTRDLMLETAPEIPGIAERAGVKIVAGPYVNREHMTVVVLEADSAEAVDQFVLETRLHQCKQTCFPFVLRMHPVSLQPAFGGRLQCLLRQLPEF